MRKRICKRCKRGIKEGDTICRYCHEPYVPSAYEVHSDSVYVSKKCMGDVSKLALMYGIMFFVYLIISGTLLVLKSIMYYV